MGNTAILRKVKTAGMSGKYYSSFLNLYLAKAYLTGWLKKPRSTGLHLDAAMQWLCRAQDASGDGGVSRSFSLVYNPYFKRTGWIPSYPETTGYIIPTMFDYARFSGRQEFFDRAVLMTEWECKVQMRSGAVQGGTIDQRPTPAIFNTGQAIFGWVRAYQETGRDKYLESAVKAGRYLIDQQCSDGAWRKNLSKYASNEMLFYTYNSRTAWALLVLAEAAQNKVFKEAGTRNIEFALTQQQENGWFRSNCLVDPSQPLLHTIAYCIRGILESGILLDNAQYVNRAKKAADALMDKQRRDGSLPGCFDDRWEPTVSWSCLTGDAQIAGIWGRLFQQTGEPGYLERMKKTNRYLMRAQMVDTSNPDLYGGISGSNPMHALYGRFEILNWAVKFFADSLMLERQIRNKDE